MIDKNLMYTCPICGSLYLAWYLNLLDKPVFVSCQEIDCRFEGSCDSGCLTFEEALDSAVKNWKNYETIQEGEE